MNYFKALLNAREITAIDFAKAVGMSVSNVRRLCEDENIRTCTKRTQKKVADGLGITIRELVEGGNSMKNKIMYAEINKAVERLCVLLRKTSSDPLFLDITIFSRDKVACDGDEEIPDYYSFRVCKADEEFEADSPLVNESSRVYYSDDDGEEKIRKVLPYCRKVREE